ncbi:T6SS immunity protein Tli4 family protein [Massilia sp. GCM10020059]|uniref:Tle cognate immunity protein 4 C-terminal domain-containing protein n=1 Tax=Massilia agrisoli TaxID=2892444 RepID=A0ABS8IU03_9BURK|nr:T6SS immunity protein Tli4 family protein [Massilia agrisoli]MCC6071663.1 hypothetical protein [Massilia agrisoli]
MTAFPSRLQALFNETKTVCFSHFTVDIPSSATLVYGPASIEAPIQYYPGEASKIEQHVANQLVAIEKDRMFFTENDFGKFPKFGKVISGPAEGHRLAFGSKDQVGYNIYSFFPVGGDLFVQSLNGVLHEDAAIRALTSVATHLRLRADDEIPSEAGSCIDGAFIPIPLKYEKVTLGVRLREFPDVHFSIQVHKNQNRIPEFSDLETRLKGAERDGGSWYSRVKFFRRGSRQIGDWKGSEALALKPAQEDQKEAHEFHFISLGAPNDPLQPQLDIQLDTGANERQMGAVKPSLTDEEAVALWDKLTGSIRLRPIGGKVPSKTPLTSAVATGGICPESGWWQCDDDGVIEADRRKRVVAGETMPHATKLGEQGLWQKLKGNRPTYQAATVWKLAEYDEAPVPPGSDHA